MATLIEAGHAKDMAEAYPMAVKAHPEVAALAEQEAERRLSRQGDRFSQQALERFEGEVLDLDLAVHPRLDPLREPPGQPGAHARDLVGDLVHVVRGQEEVVVGVGRHVRADCQ